MTGVANIGHEDLFGLSWMGNCRAWISLARRGLSLQTRGGIIHLGGAGRRDGTGTGGSRAKRPVAGTALPDGGRCPPVFLHEDILVLVSKQQKSHPRIIRKTITPLHKTYGPHVKYKHQKQTHGNHVSIPLRALLRLFLILLPMSQISRTFHLHIFFPSL